MSNKPGKLGDHHAKDNLRTMKRFVALVSMGDAVRSWTKDPSKAMAYYKTALEEIDNSEIFEPQIPSVHLLTMECREETATILAEQHHFQEALKERQELLRHFERFKGAADPITLKQKAEVEYLKMMCESESNNNLINNQKFVEIYPNRTKQQFDASLLEEGPKAPRTLFFQLELGHVKCVEGKTSEGLKMMRGAVTVCKREHGNNHPRTAELESMYRKYFQVVLENSGPVRAIFIGMKAKMGAAENGKDVEKIKLRQDGKYQVRRLGGNQMFKCSPDSLEFK